jgi:hypothetical protein
LTVAFLAGEGAPERAFGMSDTDFQPRVTRKVENLKVDPAGTASWTTFG